MSIGRNAPCPCGSGKKYKKCCLQQDEAKAQQLRKENALLYESANKMAMAMAGRESQGRELVDEAKLPEMSGQQLVDIGYSFFRRNKMREGCRPWWLAWKKLKPVIIEQGIANVEELDRLLPGKNLFYNWCQEMEMELGNEAVESWIYAFRRIAFCREFMELLPQTDLAVLRNMGRAVAESYCFLGYREKGEQLFQQLIFAHPRWEWGYVAWGDSYWLSISSNIEKVYDRAREIYQAGLAAGTGDSQVLEERLAELAATEKSRDDGEPVESDVDPAVSTPEDAESWLNVFRKTDLQASYNLFLHLANNPLAEDFANQVDVIDIALEILNPLKKNNLQEQIVELAQGMKANWGEIYREEGHYFDSLLACRFLYLEQPEPLADVMVRFQENIEKSFDYFHPVFSALIAYGHREKAIAFARQVYPVVANSDILMGGTGYIFALTVLSSHLGQAYEAVTSGKEVDWNRIREDVAQFDYDLITEQLLVIELVWTEKVTSEKVRDELEKNTSQALFLLAVGFSKYMLENKGMDFLCSSLIWKQFESLSDAEGTAFDFSYEQLTRIASDWLGARFMGLSYKKADAFVLIWGLPYVYEYLQVLEVVDPDLCKTMMDRVNIIKEDMMKSFDGDLWRYAFVQRWAPAELVDENTRQYEQEIFAHSFHRRIPLEKT